MRLKATLGLTLIAWAFACEPGGAQTFPSQPIKMVLGFAPGGITDFTGRVIAQGLSRALGGHPVVPENKPGAGGVIAAAAVAQSKPDGYSMVLIDPGTVVNPMLRTTVPYQMSQLTTVGMVGASPVVIADGAEPAGEDAEGADRLRPQESRKAELCVCRCRQRAASVGRIIHVAHHDPGLAHSVCRHRQGLSRYHRGTCPIGVQQHRWRAAVHASEPGPRARYDGNKRRPPIQTFRRWPRLDCLLRRRHLARGVGRGGNASEIIARLNEALNRALKEKEVIDQLAKVGIDAAPSTPADANAFIDREGKRWPAVIQAAGLAPK